MGVLWANLFTRDPTIELIALNDSIDRAAVPNGTSGFGSVGTRAAQLPGSFQGQPATQSAAATQAPFANTQSYGGYSQVQALRQDRAVDISDV